MDKRIVIIVNERFDEFFLIIDLFHIDYEKNNLNNKL